MRIEERAAVETLGLRRLGESEDIVAGIERILDGLASEIAKVGADLKNLERIAHARGIK